MWQEKTPTRIPEALWFSFKPATSAVDAASWRLHKLGSSIHPHEVGLERVCAVLGCVCVARSVCVCERARVVCASGCMGLRG